MILAVRIKDAPELITPRFNVGALRGAVDCRRGLRGQREVLPDSPRGVEGVQSDEKPEEDGEGDEGGEADCRHEDGECDAHAC